LPSGNQINRSDKVRRVGEFYRHHGTCSQTFRKYYNRYLASGGADAAFLPQRGGGLRDPDDAT
jgi:hypothetical protein